MTRKRNDHIEFEEVRGAAPPDADALGVKQFRAKARKNGKANGHANGFDHDKGQADQTGEKPALEFDDQIAVDTKVTALVKGVLHPGNIATLYGPSGVGKTFCAIDLAYHVALGMDWHGRRVRQAAVLYVGLEGESGLRNRMVACRQKFGSAGRMFARLTIPAPLNKSDIGKAGEEAIIKQAKLLAAASGQPVGLIIIDTVARAMSGDDENSTQDMNAYVGRKTAIAQATGAAVLSVHHTGKDETRGMRGAYALFGAVDAVIKVSENGNVRDATTEKVRDGAIGPLFSYRLNQVKLGIDEDGDEITSCTVERIDEADAPRKVERKPASVGSSVAKIALKALQRAVEESGAIPPACNHIPPKRRTVSIKTWRRYAYHADGADTIEAKRQNFKRGREALQANERVGVWGPEKASEEETQCWIIS